jgi:hypothetical protein
LFHTALVALLVGGLAAGGAGVTTALAQARKTLPQIVEMQCTIQQTAPPALVITATGAIPAGGYQEAQLKRRQYGQPPADGIQEYDLTAVTPDGVTTPVSKRPEATDQWRNYAQEAPWLKGMRIYGVADGIREAKLNTCR